MPVFTLSAPVLYALELTPACNNRCPGCFNVFVEDQGDRPALEKPPPLPLEGWREILTKIKPHAHLIKLTGGEPTLHPEFAGIVSLLRELDIPFSIFTNGGWLEPESVIALLRDTPQFRGFLISLHGAIPASHDAFSATPGSFQRTTENIRQATAAGLPVSISTVLHKHNLGEIKAIATLASELGADHVVFNRYLGLEREGISLSDKELRQAVRQIGRMQKTTAIGNRRSKIANVRFGNCIPQCFMRNSSTGCLAGVAYCTIDPWGNMRPCNHSPRLCGNLLEVPVETAWRSTVMEGFRELIPAECYTCVAFSQCHGGCRALAEELGLPGDPLMRGRMEHEAKSIEQISLYEGLRPVARCAMREEEFGYVLLRGNRVVPLAFEDKAILDTCDGQHTLREIMEAYGQDGLWLVVRLWRKGLVELS